MMSTFLVSTFRNAMDALLGRGDHAVTVPPMDGALKPNNELERCEPVIQAEMPDNLVESKGEVFFSSQDRLLRLDRGKWQAVEQQVFEADVACLAAMPTGGVAVGLANGEIRIHGGRYDGLSVRQAGDYRCHCPTAMLAMDDDHLVVAEGSTHHSALQWKHDLLKRGTSGSVWSIDLKGVRATRLAGGLGFPNGLGLYRDGSLVISEAWKHQLVKISPDGRRSIVVEDLPGYPSRIAPANDGGYWLALFAPRNQLIEFVLRERRFKQRMMSEIAEQYWVAPALSSGQDFREPLQGGAIKSMGVLKPWAPTRSYGLLVKLNAEFLPTASLHSRADGHRHGITSALEADGQLLIASKGGNQILLAPSYWKSR